ELNSALVAAVASCDVGRVKALLDEGAPANASEHRPYKTSKDWWSDTPVLYTACEKKFDEIVALLLSRGADPNSYLYRYENMMQETIPTLIAAYPSAALVERLLEAGASP
ncbi:unnamed protein product, partial [Phaeothamnion confervicola]